MTIPPVVHPAEPRSATPSQATLARIVARGLVAGLVAAAAVTGLLVGIGRRAGTVWRPLNALGHTLVGARADQVWDVAGNVTPLGGAVVLVVSAVAGIATARLATANRPLRVAAAGAGVALAGYLLHLHVVARNPGGLAALLSLGELRALYFTAGIALFAGMRFAFHLRDRASEQ